MTVNIDRIQHDLEKINAFNATPDRGITRLTFSKEYQKAQAYIIDQLRQIDAQISISHGGNLTGRIVGIHSRGPAVMLGSHLDTVVNGGRFDGLAGVVCALETARVIVEGGIAHRLPLDVVVFAEEEGARFGRGLLGSSVWTGAIDRARLQEIKDDDGVSYLEAMALAGLTVDDQDRLEPANLRAMLEVHIEQGATLEKKGKRIGLVEAIVGINQFEVTIEGMAGLTESAMIFLPSKDGRSHCPEEFTSPEDIKLGCELLLATAIELST